MPCRIGLGQLGTLLEQVLDGEGKMEDLTLIEKTARTIMDTADCAIGYTAAEMVIKGLKDSGMIMKSISVTENAWLP